MFKAIVGSASVFVIPVFAMFAASAIAVALAAGPAQARGPGIKAETAELLPFAILSDLECAAESFEGIDCNANVQRTVYSLFGANPTTQFAAIAENLLYDAITPLAVEYGLFILRNGDDRTFEELLDEDCSAIFSYLIGYIPIDASGKLAEPATIGFPKRVFESDVVFVCRLSNLSELPIAPRLILSGKLARGAKGGGKNRNK